MGGGQDEEAGHPVNGEWSNGSRRRTIGSDAGARIANPPIHSTSPIGSTALVMRSSDVGRDRDRHADHRRTGTRVRTWPNARCPAASRRMSSRPGSGNCAGSWLAAESIRMTRSPAATRAGPIDISASGAGIPRGPGRRGVTALRPPRTSVRAALASGQPHRDAGTDRATHWRESTAASARARRRFAHRRTHPHPESGLPASRPLSAPRRKSGIRRMGSRQEHFSSEPVELFRVRGRNAGRSGRQRGRPGSGECPHQVHSHARGQTLDQVAGGRLDQCATGGQPCRR